MVFRRCPEHGWLATSEYTVDDIGETVCPICFNDSETCGRDGASLHGYKENPPNGVLKDAQLNPREKFTSEMEHTNTDNKTTSSSKNDAIIEGPLCGDE